MALSEIYNVILPSDPLNQAVDDILFQLNRTTYKGVKLVASAERGLYLGDPVTGLIGIQPEPEDTPCVRIWDILQTGEDATVDLYASQWDCTISLFVYFYSFKGDDLQRFRNNYCRLLTRRISTPDGGRPDEAFSLANIDKAYFTNVGIWPPTSGKWSFTPNQQPVINHVNVFKDIDREIVMDRFWYASRIDIDITTQFTEPEE